MSKKLGADNLNEPILDHVRFEYVTLLDTQTVGDALQTLRTQTLAEQIIYFYVVNAEGALVGVVPTRRLLMSLLEAKVADIMVRRLVTVPYSATVLDACEMFIQHRFLSLPVVDDERRLMGVADVSLFTDVFDVAERQRGEDVYQLIGVHLTAYRRLNPLQSFLKRFPWLVCNIVGGLLCAILSSFYESYLVDVVVLALFIPVVLALSESVSIQAMTIALEALHGERLDFRFVLKALGRELAAAAMLGAACGGSVGVIAWLWKGLPWVALAIGGSIALAMVTACLLGVALPALVRAFRVDPRIAAGPIVLATADVATLLFYFNLAGWLLGLE
jgi:magnesium transporter